MNAITLGRRIYLYRKRQKLTQATVAEMTNISVPYLVQLEKGKRMPSLSLLIRLTEALEITPNDLLLDSKHSTYTEATRLLRSLLEEMEKGKLRYE